MGKIHFSVTIIFVALFIKRGNQCVQYQDETWILILKEYEMFCIGTKLFETCVTIKHVDTGYRAIKL